MVTDIRQALRDTVEEAPPDRLDLADLITVGTRRVHRRRSVAARAAGLVLVLVVGVATLPTGADRAEERDPADLGIDDARTVEPHVVATRRLWWEYARHADISYDRFDAITDDGLVARARYTYDGDISEFGLLDIETGRTDWLPRPRWDVGEPVPVDLGVDRLVYLDNRHHPRLAVLTFDRDSRTWSREQIQVPGADTGRFFGSSPQLGGDGRLYLLDPETPTQWWSVPLTGGPARPEPSLENRSVVWSGSLLATAGTDGHIIVTRDGQQTAEIGGPPEDCASPDGPAVGPGVFAGTKLVVTFRCVDGQQIVVYDEAGRPELTVSATGAWAVAADPRYVLLVDDRRTYALDLQRRELLAMDYHGGAAIRDPVGMVKQGLVLWSVDGPNEDHDTHDVVYQVARFP